MGPLPLFGLAAQHAKWLSVRQAAVSQNLANVNTPGFRAMDVRPFQDVLQRVQTDLAATHVGHIAASSLSLLSSALRQADGGGRDGLGQFGKPGAGVAQGWRRQPRLRAERRRREILPPDAARQREGRRMIDPLQSALRIAGSGLDVQSARMRVVSENIANASSTGSTPGADPYARKTI